MCTRVRMVRRQVQRRPGGRFTATKKKPGAAPQEENVVTHVILILGALVLAREARLLAVETIRHRRVTRRLMELCQRKTS
jgi:hypothetical protein